MLFSLLADVVVLIHLAFILFAACGVILVWRSLRLIWLHLPAVLWAAAIELSGGICPLTPLENRLRRLGGESGYTGGFVEHWVVPLIYPGGLTREMQTGLGLVVLAVNATAYLVLARRLIRRRGA
ncbi:DUF2784 domain-containing protein [Propionivibrio soli]|uniref:DUF2784 domain-containing protein n=1 Tax=Propionivibrio soli TaxID=2976531 RepID=UPI0021E8A7B9|nr:DUF2784 domain-containing protein [Propionivibrio soli]